jgi:hypothetical protein
MVNFICCNCNYSTQYGSEYLNHAKIHRFDPKSIFKCWQCLSTYKNFQSFRTHFANFHLNNDKEIPNSEIFECKKENCNYLCESRNVLFRPNDWKLSKFGFLSEIFDFYPETTLEKAETNLKILNFLEF